MAGMDLTGKTALITGAARGIGAAIAESYAAAGATVIVNARTETYLEPLVERLQRETRVKAFALPCDASSSDGVHRLKEQVIELGQKVDILVNGVGDAIVGDLVPITAGGASVSEADIDQSVALNLLSAIYCTKAFGGDMVANGWGRVINISSALGALRGHAGLSVYCACKAGVVGLTRSLAVEWGRFGVTVNAIAPGCAPDPAHHSPEQMEGLEAVFLPKIPVGRLGTLGDFGDLATFLASDAGSYVNGQVIAVDGGLSA